MHANRLGLLARSSSSMAAPSAASAATGPLLVAHARARDQRPPRPGRPALARAGRHAAVGRGPDGDRALLPPRPQAAVVNVNLPMSATGKSGMALVAFKTSTPAAGRDPRHPPGDADRAAARGHAGEGERRRAARAPGRARPRRAPAAAAPGGHGLRRRRSAASSTTAPRAPCWPSARSPAWRARPSPTPACSGRCWPARAPSRSAIPTTASTSRPTSHARSSR